VRINYTPTNVALGFRILAHAALSTEFGALLQQGMVSGELVRGINTGIITIIATIPPTASVRISYYSSKLLRALSYSFVVLHLGELVRGINTLHYIIILIVLITLTVTVLLQGFPTYWLLQGFPTYILMGNCGEVGGARRGF
jgi:hypothetical protein